MSGGQGAGETSNHSPGPLHGLTIAHVGHFDPEYSRNRIMGKALRRAGATVLTLTDERTFARRIPNLTRRVRALRPDAVLVGFPGYADVPAVRLAAGRLTPVVFDAFVSLYETNVEDRGLTAPESLAARRYAIEDRIACRLASRVVLDTDTHARYFSEHIGVSPQKLRRVWVGADDDVMRPGPRPADTEFRVFVYGSFVPLQGFEHVVRAAHLLEQRGEAITVDIVGSGQTEHEVRRLAADLGTANVRFLGRRPYGDLPALMANSHVCLGIFGGSGKAARVIPNKVYDALAVARPVLTADTEAIREALTHGDDAWLCAPADPEALAEALVTLKSDAALRERLAQNGHRRFCDQFSIAAITRDVTAVMLDALRSAS